MFAGASDTMSLCVSDNGDHESDKLSVVSETDSGVVGCGRSELIFLRLAYNLYKNCWV